MFYGGFAPYVRVAERRRQAARKVAALKQQGVTARPVVIEGRRIARTFWGKAWCENLEAYSDYANRLPRGRTYARNGSVIDLQLARGSVRALVSGSSIYEVEVDIRPLPAKRWAALVQECAGRIDSVVELLAGKLSQGVMESLCRKGEGLFPGPREISLRCSCPDSAYLCKHLAAVLYGVGARLDAEPELLFVLRGVAQEDLLSRAAEGGMLVRDQARPNALSEGDLSGLFGIELAPGDSCRDTASRKPGRDPARVTSGELVAHGLSRSTIQRWLAQGLLLRTSERGVYLKTRKAEAKLRQA